MLLAVTQFGTVVHRASQIIQILTVRGAWHLDQDIKGGKTRSGALESVSRSVGSTSFMCGRTLYIVRVFSVIFFI